MSSQIVCALSLDNYYIGRCLSTCYTPNDEPPNQSSEPSDEPSDEPSETDNKPDRTKKMIPYLTRIEICSSTVMMEMMKLLGRWKQGILDKEARKLPLEILSVYYTGLSLRKLGQAT
jgi:hypothetical protein